MAGDGQPVALVSGANRGIGREIARQLAMDHGYTVLAGARDPGAIGKLEHEWIIPVQLDVADQASVDRLAEKITSHPGRLDALVNNAGVLVNTMCPGWVRTDMGGPSASRSVEEGAETAVWLATLPEDGPSGGFFRDRKPIPW